MSREAATGGSAPRIDRAAASRTRRALAAALGDRVAAAVLAVTALAYLLVYLAAVGDVGSAGDRTAPGTAAIDVAVVSDPIARSLGGEAVALVRLGPVEALVVPETLAVALGLALLVGANLALSMLAWRRPAACAVSPVSGVTAGLPALLSGTACCGPLVFIVLGLQATSTALTAIAWLRPVVALVLAASLVWAAWQLDVQPSTGEVSRRAAPES